VDWLRTVELFAPVPQNYLEVEFDSIMCCLSGSSKIAFKNGIKT
jgi:hypothetical protein